MHSFLASLLLILTQNIWLKYLLMLHPFSGINYWIMFPLLTCHQNIDIWSLKLNLQVKISVNIWYINYSLAHLIGRSQNGVLETVAQYSYSWVANTFWGSWNFTKVTRLWPKLPLAGSQNLLVTQFCQYGSWVVTENHCKNGSVLCVCMFV